MIIVVVYNVQSYKRYYIYWGHIIIYSLLSIVVVIVVVVAALAAVAAIVRMRVRRRYH